MGLPSTPWCMITQPTLFCDCNRWRLPQEQFTSQMASSADTELKKERKQKFNFNEATLKHLRETSKNIIHGQIVWEMKVISSKEHSPCQQYYLSSLFLIALNYQGRHEFPPCWFWKELCLLVYFLYVLDSTHTCWRWEQMQCVLWLFPFFTCKVLGQFPKLPSTPFITVFLHGVHRHFSISKGLKGSSFI